MVAGLEASGEGLALDQVELWQSRLDALLMRAGEHVLRREARIQLHDYAKGLLGQVGRKNTWQIAEHVGHATSDGLQRLLARAVWDPEKERDTVRDYVIEHLGAADGVLIVDETGFVKKRTTSAGVGRQYTGTSGKVDNCQLAVFAAYPSHRGRALVDRELYLPKSWMDDPERCRAAGIPDGREFATKPQIARFLLTRLVEAGMPARWVAADEAYGQDYRFRRALEQLGVGHVLAVPKSQQVRTFGATRRMDELIRVAGTRWAIEECFQAAKNKTGLDQYEVCRYPGWYRHLALAMLAQAFLAAQAAEAAEKGATAVINPWSSTCQWERSGGSRRLSVC